MPQHFYICTVCSESHMVTHENSLSRGISTHIHSHRMKYSKTRTVTIIYEEDGFSDPPIEWILKWRMSEPGQESKKAGIDDEQSDP